jgi:hypothetical protein
MRDENIVVRLLELTFVALLVAIVLINADEFAKVAESVSGSYATGVRAFLGPLGARAR